MPKIYHYGQFQSLPERSVRPLRCRLRLHAWNAETLSPGLVVRTCCFCGTEQIIEEPGLQLWELGRPQAEGVGDDAHRGERHRGGGNYRGKKDTEGRIEDTRRDRHPGGV